MKLVLVIIAMAFSFSSHASFYQVNCSNAEGTTKTANGHVQNFLKVTKRIYDYGHVDEEVIELDTVNDVSMKYTETTEISQENEGGCILGNKSGFTSWKTTTVIKVKITKQNGGKFNSHIVGVSTDLKSIEDQLICVEEGNSMIFCED